MAFTHKIDRGSVFPQETKKSETDRDYSGSCKLSTPDGKVYDYWISGWVNDGKNGKYLSLSFKLKDEQPKGVTSTAASDALTGAAVTGPAPPIQQDGVKAEDLDDDIPF